MTSGSGHRRPSGAAADGRRTRSGPDRRARQRGRQCHGRVGRRGALARRRRRARLAPASKGIHITVPRSRLDCDIAAVIPVPKDKRLGLRRPVARGRPGLRGHHRHVLSGLARGPRVHPRRRGLPARRRQRLDQRGAHEGGRHRGVGRTASTARSERRSADLGAHRRPQPPPLRAHIGFGRDHGDRRQVDDVPEDGRGHGRRGPRSWPAFGRRRCVTKNLALLGAPAPRGDDRRAYGRPGAARASRASLRH